MITSRASRLTYLKPDEAVIEKCQVSDFKDDSVLINVLHSGISRGTESLVYGGKVPVSEWTRMRCPHQVGEFSFPITYGYACCGVVIETGADVSKVKPGQKVFVLHPHQDVICVGEDMCNPLPDNLPTTRGVLSANMETALNAFWDAEIEDAGSHAVIGCGVVGLLTAYVLKHETDRKPIVVDMNEEKRQIAEMLGFDFQTPKSLSKHSVSEFDHVFNTSASGAGLQTGIDIASFEGKIIEMSWYGEKEVTLKLGGTFHSKRLQIISSQVGHIAPKHRETIDYSQRMSRAMTYLCDPNLDQLLENPIDFKSLPVHLEDIFSPDSNILCQLVNYNHT